MTSSIPTHKTAEQLLDDLAFLLTRMREHANKAIEIRGKLALLDLSEQDRDYLRMIHQKTASSLQEVIDYV